MGRIKGVTSKVYGSYEEGIGEILPATNKARWLKIQFRSNKRKNAGGFRCQFAAVAPFTGTGSGSGSSTGSGSGSTTGTGSGASCLTNSGPASGSPCVFPFNYMGVSHFGCTTIDGDTTPWCSTQTDANDDHVSGVGAWGYCDASCPVQETEAHEYPWQVGLVSRNGRSPWCGGTLISSTHVLTAAHCTQSDASSIRVILGEHNIADSDFNRVDVAEIINHPNYNPQTTDNDYAILRLANPVTFTNEVSPACLPADLSNTFAGVLATVTGWGTLSSGGSQPTVLQEVDVTVTTNTECNNAYGSITANMVCAADSGKDSCQGDSGGPMIAPENGRQALIGVVSWGRGCAFEGFPGVYARVTEKMDWILANTAGTFSSTCAALN